MSRTAVIEQMRFDSDAFAPEERLDRYRSFNSPTNVLATGPDFAMQAARWRLDRRVIHARRSNDVLHSRGADELADGLDHILVHLVIEGDYAADTGDGYRPVPPDTALIVDMTKAFSTRARRARVITLSFAREAVSPVLSGACGVHGRLIGGSALLPLADCLTSFCRNADYLPASIAPSLAQALLALFAAAYDGLLTADDAAAPPELHPFDRARRIIDARLADPGLDAAIIAERSGLSRATLYRLFEDHGGLMSYVRARRLDRVRASLSNLADQRPLSELAFDAGFANESYLSRQFLAAYGVRPSAYRERVAQAIGEARPDARLEYWLSELQ